MKVIILRIPWYNLKNLDGETIIWRYMDIIKFLDLIQTQQLYFSNIENFNDPYEGFVSIDYKEMELKNFKTVEEKNLYEAEKKEELKNYFINCWHINNYENVAMWKAYTDSNNGIAIKSTITDLVVAIGLKNYNNKEYNNNISFGKVEYIGDLNDEEILKIKNKTIFNDKTKILLYKNISFKDENEVRLIIRKKKNNNNYCKLDIDINKLINEIYIIPTAPTYYRHIIEKLIEKYNIKNIDVSTGKITDIPIIQTDIFK
jgi:hypothetical protein